MRTHPIIEELEEIAPAADLRPLGSDGPMAERVSATMRRLGPGVVLVAGCVVAAFVVNGMVPAVSVLVAAVAIGAILANTGRLPEACAPGTQFAAKRLLRFGVVLLGFRLAVGDVVALGAPGLVVVVTVVAATFFGTQWIGRRLGVTPSLSLLIATGFSICGASAVAAMDGVSDADDDEVAFAIALVTLCGSLAIAVLPLLAAPLGLAGAPFGAWVGASVHDVAQVVAAASTGGNESLDAAVIVKLTRVIMLAPIVAGVTVAVRARKRAVEGALAQTELMDRADPMDRTEPMDRADLMDHPGGDVVTARTGQPDPTGAFSSPPLIPLFVAGFLAAIAVRSSGILPAAWIEALATVEKLALAAALVGLGAGVRVSRLRSIGGKPLLLAGISWVLVAGVAYLGVSFVAI